MKGYDAKFLDELKSKNDIISIISAYVQLEQRGSNYWGRCPFHHEKTASFCVNALDNFYYCFGCHKSGDVISFVMELENIDFGDAVKLLAEKANIPLPEMNEDSERIKETRKKKETLLNILRDSALYYVSNLKKEGAKTHLEYLARRGLDQKTLVKFGLGASLDFDGLPKFLSSKGYDKKDMFDAGVVGMKNDRYFDALGGRLIIPVINQMNQVVAFCGRILDPKGFAKYVNTKETLVFSKSNILFNINNLKKLKNEQGLKNIIIVEGHMDVISLVQGGFLNVVASMGTSLTKDQARILKRYSDNVLICYDGDFAGQKASIRGLEILKDEGINVKVVSLPDGLDPDDVVKSQGAAAYQKLLDDAKPLIDFKLDILKKTFDINNTDGKRKYITEAIKVIKESPSIAEQEDLLKRMRADTGITYESLKRELENTETAKPIEKEVNITVAATEKNMQAERYILFSVLFMKPYAKNFDISEITFSDQTHREIAEYIIETKSENKDLKPNLLYDIVADENKEELSFVLAEELVEKKNFNEAKYFNDCVTTIKKVLLKTEITELTKMCEEETDLTIRKELTQRLMAKMSEINRLN